MAHVGVLLACVWTPVKKKARSEKRQIGYSLIKSGFLLQMEKVLFLLKGKNTTSGQRWSKEAASLLIPKKMIKSQREPFRNSPAANEERSTLWCHQLQKRWSRIDTQLRSSLGRLVGRAPHASSFSRRIGNAKHRHQPSNRQTAHLRCRGCLPWWQGMTTGWNIPQGQRWWEGSRPARLTTEGSKACGNGIHQVERTVGNRNEHRAPGFY